MNVVHLSPATPTEDLRALEEVDEFARFGLGEEVGVDLGGVGVENNLFCDSALDGAQTGVCVLEVGAGVAVPGGHSVDIEVV